MTVPLLQLIIQACMYITHKETAAGTLIKSPMNRDVHKTCSCGDACLAYRWRRARHLAGLRRTWTSCFRRQCSKQCAKLFTHVQYLSNEKYTKVYFFCLTSVTSHLLCHWKSHHLAGSRTFIWNLYICTSLGCQKTVFEKGEWKKQEETRNPKVRRCVGNHLARSARPSSLYGINAT